MHPQTISVIKSQTEWFAFYTIYRHLTGIKEGTFLCLRNLFVIHLRYL